MQQGVTASTAIGFLVQMMGLTLAGQMERLGLPLVLFVQAGCLGLGAVMIRRLSAQPPPLPSSGESVWQGVVAGFKATYRHRAIYHVLIINFVSSIFNAGAFTTVFPFIIKRIYDGDAMLLATMMILFFGGAMASNLLLLRFMPLRHPGRMYLILQLSRSAIVLILWVQPAMWLLMLTIIAWGLNMGVTQTLARTVVQESAEAAYRGRILSVFNLGMLGSAPIGAVVLGWTIEIFGTLNALIPAMVVSIVLCGYGLIFTDIWRYRSPA